MRRWSYWGIAYFTHLGIVLWFLVYIVYSKHLHIFIAPLNVFFYDLTPKGAMEPITDIEQRIERRGDARRGHDRATWAGKT